MGFEPTRAEHNGLGGRRLNHLATVSIVHLLIEVRGLFYLLIEVRCVSISDHATLHKIP